MKIYKVEVPENFNKHTFHSLLPFLHEDKQKRVNKFYNYADALRSVFSDLLIRMILVEQYNMNNEEISFCYNKYGKPFVEGLEGFYFNVSHSEKWIICAIDKTEIGIDVEKISPIELNIAKRFFTKIEYLDLLDKPEEDRLGYFYDLWTLKESYIKACGRGLSISLDSFSFRKDKEKIVFEGQDMKNKYFFKQYDIGKGYKLSACALHENFPKELIDIAVDKISYYFLSMRPVI